MKKLSYTTNLITLLLIMSNSTLCQSVHYSQFFSSPLNLNPAHTGVINGDWRVVSNSRSQGNYYSDPLNTISLSYDRVFNIYNSQVGAGLIYSHDYSEGISIPTHKTYLSLGNMIQVSEKSFLGIGLQLGWINKSLSYNHLTFLEQYDRSEGSYNPNLPLSENFQYLSSNYLDINAGFLWQHKAERYHISTGIATFHLNQPQDNFLETQNKTSVRTNWHGSLKYDLNSKVFILPQSYYTFQNKTSEFVIGSNAGLNIESSEHKFKSISLGAYFRNGFINNLESLIFVTGLNYNNWTTFLSFDVDVSGLKTNPIFNHAVELSLVYERPSSILKKTTIPCIRY
ncbi:type IX secretion system membrane protein PorP/SprF [Labilibacter sediminis]|nr:type IX secretion system membrane protein PorP/SprF [Labilibacter sediminis]